MSQSGEFGTLSDDEFRADVSLSTGSLTSPSGGYESEGGQVASPDASTITPHMQNEEDVVFVHDSEVSHDKKFLHNLMKEKDPRITYVKFGKKKQLDYWAAFESVHLEGNPTEYACCLVCRIPVKYRSKSGSKNTTTNGGVKKHWESCKKSAADGNPGKEKVISALRKITFKKSSHSLAKIANIKDRKEVKKRLVTFFLALGLSFNKAGSNVMKKFASEISLMTVMYGQGKAIDFEAAGHLPDRLQISHLAKEKGNEMKIAITSLMANKRVSSISATCDHWSDASNRNMYLGVTAQCVVKDKKNQSPKTVNIILSLVEATGKDHKKLLLDFNDVISSYGIAKKLNFIVSDGASVNRAAFDKGDSFAKVMLRLKEADEEEEDSDGESVCSSTHSELMSEDDFDEELAEFSRHGAEPPDMTDQELPCLGKVWIWCAAHQTMLAMKAAFKSVGKEPSGKQAKIVKYLDDCQKLVKSMRKKSAGQLLSISLKKFTDIRWDSRLMMVESIICEKNRPVLESLTKTSKELGPLITRCLNGERVNVLKEFVELVSEIKNQRLKLSGDTEPTLGLVAWTKYKMIKHCNKMADESNGKSDTIRKLASEMAAAIDLKLHVTVFHAAAFLLNPNYPHNIVAAVLGNELLSKAEKLVERLLQKQPNDEQGQPHEYGWEADFDELLQQNGTSGNSLVMSELAEFRGRRIAAGSQLVYWTDHEKKFPKLSRVASYFHAPATSNSAERTFSEAAHVLGNRKMRLSPVKLEAIILCNSNRSLIDDGIITLYENDGDNDDDISFMCDTSSQPSSQLSNTSNANNSDLLSSQ